MTNISIIVALSKNRVIGLNNQLPWHISSDLKRFKSITMGKPIVMGRKTWLSLGRPLPGRENIVISRNKQFLAEGCSIFHCLDDVLEHYAQEQEVMIIGGSTIYELALPIARKLYVTQIHRIYQGDTFFPDIKSDWCEIYREDHPSTENTPAYSFLELVRPDETPSE